jgi:NADPH2:quinone reductase
MRVVRYDRFGGIAELWIDEAPVPEAGPGQVVVQVRASCINPGSLSALRGAAYVPARDLAGTVVAVGDGVHHIAVDDEVLGWLQDWSAHAEYAAVPAGQLIPKPRALPWDVAGSLFVTPMAGLAGVQAVAPQKGDVIVVAGASGGVGLTAVQLARRAGATVIGIASPANSDRLREFDAVPVAYGDDVVPDVRAASRGSVDAFIDAFGSGYIDVALELGIPADRIATVVDYRAAQERGVTALGTMDAGGLPALTGLADLAGRGELRVPIAAGYPLAGVQDAYRSLAEEGPFGRVVLHPQE